MPAFWADVYSLLYNSRMSDKPRVKFTRTKRYVIEPPVKLNAEFKIISPGSKEEAKHWQLTVSARGTGAKKKRFYYDTERAAKEDRERKQAEIDQREFVGFSMPGPKSASIPRIARFMMARRRVVGLLSWP